MTHYKLTYFNGRGRAELARLIFAAAGVQYDDIRITQEEWPALKPKTPFGQVPILEFDGVILGQSYTIARFLAKRFGLAGKTDVDQARADMIVDCFHDILTPIATAIWLTEEAKKAEVKKKLIEEQIPSFLALLEKLLEQNNGGTGFFVGSELSWADLAMLSLGPWIEMIGSKSDEVYAKYPKLDAHRRRVAAVPRVAEWLAKRPDSAY